MDSARSEDQQKTMPNNSTSQKKRNRNKSYNQSKSEVDIKAAEIPLEDAMKTLSMAPHQVHIFFHFISPLIIFVTV